MIPDVVPLHFKAVGSREKDADVFIALFDGVDEDILTLDVASEAVEG